MRESVAIMVMDAVLSMPFQKKTEADAAPNDAHDRVITFYASALNVRGDPLAICPEFVQHQQVKIDLQSWLHSQLQRQDLPVVQATALVVKSRRAMEWLDGVYRLWLDRSFVPFSNRTSVADCFNMNEELAAAGAKNRKAFGDVLVQRVLDARRLVHETTCAAQTWCAIDELSESVRLLVAAGLSTYRNWFESNLLETLSTVAPAAKTSNGTAGSIWEELRRDRDFAARVLHHSTVEPFLVACSSLRLQLSPNACVSMLAEMLPTRNSDVGVVYAAARANLPSWDLFAAEFTRLINAELQALEGDALFSALYEILSFVKCSCSNNGALRSSALTTAKDRIRSTGGLMPKYLARFCDRSQRSALPMPFVEMVFEACRGLVDLDQVGEELQLKLTRRILTQRSPGPDAEEMLVKCITKRLGAGATRLLPRLVNDFRDATAVATKVGVVQGVTIRFQPFASNAVPSFLQTRALGTALLPIARVVMHAYSQRCTMRRSLRWAPLMSSITVDWHHTGRAKVSTVELSMLHWLVLEHLAELKDDDIATSLFCLQVQRLVTALNVSEIFVMRAIEDLLQAKVLVKGSTDGPVSVATTHDKCNIQVKGFVLAPAAATHSGRSETALSAAHRRTTLDSVVSHALKRHGRLRDVSEVLTVLLRDERLAVRRLDPRPSIEEVGNSVTRLADREFLRRDGSHIVYLP